MYNSPSDLPLMGSDAYTVNSAMMKDLLAPQYKTVEQVSLGIKEAYEDLKGNKEDIKYFLNIQDPTTKQTLLHALIVGCVNDYYSRYWVSKLFLKMGMDPNLQDQQGNTALHTIVEALEEDMKTRHEYTNEPEKDVLVRDHLESSLESMSVLIAYGGDLLRKNNKGETVFQYLSRVIENIGKDSALVKKATYNMEALKNYYTNMLKDKLPFFLKEQPYDISLKEGLENFDKFSHLKILDFKQQATTHVGRLEQQQQREVAAAPSSCLLI